MARNKKLEQKQKIFAKIHHRIKENGGLQKFTYVRHDGEKIDIKEMKEHQFDEIFSESTKKMTRKEIVFQRLVWNPKKRYWVILPGIFNTQRKIQKEKIEFTDYNFSKETQIYFYGGVLNNQDSRIPTKKAETQEAMNFDGL